MVTQKRTKMAEIDSIQKIKFALSNLDTMSLFTHFDKIATMNWESVNILHRHREQLFPPFANFQLMLDFECDSPELIITVSLKVVFQIVSDCQHLLNSRFVSFTFDYLTIFHHYVVEIHQTQLHTHFTLTMAKLSVLLKNIG